MAASTTAWVNFNGKDIGVKVSIKAIEDGIDRMSRKGKKDIDSLAASFNKFKKNISSLSGGMGNIPLLSGIGVAGMFAAGKTAIDKFAGRESEETGIKFLSKTEEEYKSNMSFLRNLSREYGISFSGMLGGYKQLKANMNMMDIAPEEQNEKFKKISAAIRVMGLNAEESGSVFYAISQMMSKGKIQAQELRTQLANVFPAAVPILAQSMGITVGKLDKMLDQGAIKWEKYGNNFIDYMYNYVEKGVPEATKKVSAELARIGNSFEDTWVKIGDAIVRSGALGMISEMGYELGNWVDANKDMIAISMKKGVNFIKDGFQWAMEHKDELKSLLTSLTAFTIGLKTVDLVTSFANPIKLAAASMVVIGAIIDKAISDLSIAKKQEAEGTGKGYLGAGESAWAGLKNFGYGAFNAITGSAGYLIPSPFGGTFGDSEQVKRGGSQLWRSLFQLGGSAMQGLSLGYKSFKEAEGLDKGAINRANQKYEMIGRRNLGYESQLYPEDFVPERIKAETQGKAERETKELGRFKDWFVEGMSGMNMNINIDSTGRASFNFNDTIPMPVSPNIK